VRGPEKKNAVDIHQETRRRTVGARVDILDNHRTGRRSVALPQLLAARAVVSGKKQRAVYIGEKERLRAVLRAGIWIDEFDDPGSDTGAVTPPEFGPVRVHLGSEKE